jgi:hypothetical protein
MKAQTPAPTPSYAKLVAKAVELRKADPKLTEAQAFEKIYTDPLNGELVHAAKAEHRAAVVAAQRTA